MRLDSFTNSAQSSIDEEVYFRMARQVMHEGPRGYQTIPYGKELASHGRPLPTYFFEPLFKHPPLFVYSLIPSMSLLGEKRIAAFIIPLLMGCLLIPLVYWIGILIGDKRVGLFAALIQWLDPINNMCSQKVWLDTMMASLMTAAIAFYIAAYLKKGERNFIWAGCCLGLAMNVKYTACLLLPVIVIFTVLHDRTLWKNKYFIAGIFIPFVLMIPWAIWNYQVYGLDMFTRQVSNHSDILGLIKKISRIQYLFLPILLAGMILWKILAKRAKNITTYTASTRTINPIIIAGWLVLFITLVIYTKNYWTRGLSFYNLPHVSWGGAYFYRQPASFYFGRILEFSPLIILGYWSLFSLQEKENVAFSFLRLVIFSITSFLMLWGGVQARYILPVVPLVIVLTAYQSWKVFDYIQTKKSGLQRNLLLIGFLCFIIYSLLKTTYINIAVVYPNNMCYF